MEPYSLGHALGLLPPNTRPFFGAQRAHVKSQRSLNLPVGIETDPLFGTGLTSYTDRAFGGGSILKLCGRFSRIALAQIWARETIKQIPADLDDPIPTAGVMQLPEPYP